MFDQAEHRPDHPDHRAGHQADRLAAERRLWRIVGSLAVVHIVLMLAGFALQRVSRLGDAPGTALAIYRGSSLGAAGIGSAVSLLGFVALLFAAPLMARLLRGDTEGTRWLSGVIASTASVYVAITLAVGFAASGTARYGAHHAMTASTVSALSTLHWFAVFTATAVLGVFILTVAGRIWATRLLPRWVAGFGFLAGACCLAAAVNPPENLVDDVTLVWMAWFAALGVSALTGRREPRRAPVAAASAA
jgi:hypothetical protein